MEKEILLLDYYPITLYPSEYEKTVNKGGYVKIPYLHSKGDSQPNFVHNGRKYKTETMYIQKSTIPKNGADGELVVKHVPITNGDVPIYLVIPLKTQPTVYEETPVDKIINNLYSSSFQFDLGETIGYNKIGKVNDANTVYVLSPMIVKTVFDKDHGFANVSDISEQWNYDNTKTKFREISILFAGLEPLDEKKPIIVEGNTTMSDSNDEFYYDCKPIIENGGAIKPSIEVMPITSQLAKNMGTMNVLTATVHFFIFLFMVIFAAFSTPFLYRIFFVDYITALNISKGEAQFASLKIWDYIGSFILFMFSIGISIGGMSVGDKLQTSIGAMITIFLLISITVITYYKHMYPEKYSFGKYDDTDVLTNGGILLLSTIIDKISHNKSSTIFGIVLSVVIGLITYYAGKGKFDKKSKKKDKSKRNFIFSYFSIFGSIFSIYFVSRMFKMNDAVGSP